MIQQKLDVGQIGVSHDTEESEIHEELVIHGKALNLVAGSTGWSSQCSRETVAGPSSSTSTSSGRNVYIGESPLTLQTMTGPTARTCKGKTTFSKLFITPWSHTGHHSPVNRRLSGDTKEDEATGATASACKGDLFGLPKLDMVTSGGASNADSTQLEMTDAGKLAEKEKQKLDASKDAHVERFCKPGKCP